MIIQGGDGLVAARHLNMFGERGRATLAFI
jgi:NAD(P)H-hydrate repair Nnr-like enzyme with NAD(P)H-hydrate epimerase domain